MTEINTEATATADNHAQSPTQAQSHAHTHSHTHCQPHTAAATTGTKAPATDEQYWDDRYGQSERMWSGNPNPVLVREAADLPPGHALDLGCGEGADAIWLAARGWRVTAVDVSRVAMDRGAVRAGSAGAGVAERIDWQLHDLGTSFPVGSFDLVSAQFLYFRAAASREQILRAAAAAVAPGGILLIEGHAGFPASADHPHAETGFPTPEATVAALDLAAGEWEILLAEEHEREHNDPTGKSTVHTDSTVKVKRLAG
jgi:SAM-dependent methyltransferase